MLVFVARAVLTIIYEICSFKPSGHACFISRMSQFPILGVLRGNFLFSNLNGRLCKQNGGDPNQSPHNAVSD